MTLKEFIIKHIHPRMENDTFNVNGYDFIFVSDVDRCSIDRNDVIRYINVEALNFQNTIEICNDSVGGSFDFKLNESMEQFNDPELNDIDIMMYDFYTRIKREDKINNFLK